MYNRYIPEGTEYARIPEEEPGRAPHREAPHRNGGGGSGGFDFGKLFSAFGQKENAGGLTGILKKLNLDGMDTGDILLMLIILLVFLDGDNLDLVIALGVMLLLGLNDKGEDTVS